MVVGPWVMNHRNRLIGTGVVMVGWCALTYPTSNMWLPKFYYKFAPTTVAQIANNTAALINEVLTDLNIGRPGKPIDLQKLFIVQGHYPFPEFQHRGSIHTGGAYIVLTSGFEKSQISRMLPKHVAQKMLLPEEVQKFALARQIVYAGDNFELVKCFVGLICIAVYSALAQRSLTRFKATFETFKKIPKIHAIPEDLLHNALLVARIPLLFVPIVNLYWALVYGYSRRSEREADKLVASLGREYVIGGMMFYRHALETGRKKKTPIQYKKFKENGDLHAGWIHQKTLPWTTRLKFFENILENEKLQKVQDEKTILPTAPIVAKQP